MLDQATRKLRRNIPERPTAFTVELGECAALLRKAAAAQGTTPELLAAGMIAVHLQD